MKIRTWIEELGIECDYEARSAYAYTGDPNRMNDICKEAEAAREVGFDARVLDRAPLPFPTAGALEFPDQAQFNPASYLVGLAEVVQCRGGRIYEQSRAQIVRSRSGLARQSTDLGTVQASQVVIATNITVKSPIGYANRTQPCSHVVMAFRTKDPAAVDGMFISIDEPTHSIRTGRDRDGPLIITLGAPLQHRAGRQRGTPFRRARGMDAGPSSGSGGRLALVQRGLRYCRSHAICGSARPRRLRPVSTWRPASMPGASAMERPLGF